LNFGVCQNRLSKIRSQGYEPEGYTLSSYAAVQSWAAGVVQANSLMAKGSCCLAPDEC
jgi:branched-chain amino acid transport system substrate-binding protein